MLIGVKACALDNLAVSGVRLRAAEVVGQVLAGRSLTEALPAALCQLPVKEHAFCKALSFGTLRWYHRLEFLLRQLCVRPIKDPKIHALALVGLHQLAFMAVKPHAAVAETVAAAKPWARPLINALLRAYQRQRDALEKAAEADYEASVSHSAWLRQRIEQAWPRQAAAVLAANLAHPPFAVRVNLARVSRAAYAQRLLAQGLKAQEVAAVDSALRLDRPVPVEELPGFAQGLVSVQDAAAQLAAPLLAVQPGQRVLDVCAAPGGKTLHILESCPELAEVVAVDVSQERLQGVRENLARAGVAGKARLICADARDPSWWDGRHFERILVDAPCTASGVVRRHPDIKLLRRESDVAALAARQREILSAVWPLLARGGRLLYVTCSLLPEENEAQIRAFLAEHPDARAVPIHAAWGQVTGWGRQILPGEQDMDGFFYACLEKC
ncbi:16S rRNA (cytosine(967)-C(5))-methyltransferase RsmB [Methylothermus subterraneus]